MAIPAHLNRTQFHELLTKFTGNPNIRHSQFQKALKEAGVHKEVMYGARFGREKTTKILSTLKEHLESSYKEKGYGVRGRGTLFHENPEHVYRQHVRKLAQDDIAAQNKARTDVARQQAIQTQAQKRVQEARQRLRNAPLTTAPSASPARPAQDKKKDGTVVPPPSKEQGELYGEGIAALSGTARPEQENPTFFEDARHVSGTNRPAASPAEANLLSGMSKEKEAPESVPGISDESEDADLPDTDAVDRGLPL